MKFLDVLGGIGVGTSALGAIGSFFDNSYQEVAEQNRAWQSEENQKNRDFQSAEWQRQFDVTNDYNDPQKQVARLAKAGINPALAFGNGNASIGQSGASPSAPSGASSSVTTPFSDSVLTHGFMSADAFNRAVESYSKLSANAQDAPLKRASERLLLNQASHEAVKQELSEFDYRMQLIYGDALRNQEVNNAVAQYKNTLQDTLLKIAETGVADNKALELAESRLLMHTKRLLHGTERELLLKQLKYADKYQQSMINYYNSVAAKERAESESVGFWNALYRDERDYLVKNIQNDAAKKYQDVKLTQGQIDLLRHHISLARYADDQKEIKFWNDLIANDLKIGADIVEDFTRLSSFKALSKSQQDKVRIEQDKVRLDKEKFDYESGTYEDVYNRFDKQGRKHTLKGRRDVSTGQPWRR